MALTGSQRKQLSDALIDAFPSVSDLTMLLQFRLSRSIQTIAPPADTLSFQVFKIIEAAEAQNWTFKLVAAARESNPDNVKLLVFAQQFGLAATKMARDELESLISKSQGYIEVAKWRSLLGALEARVCRIELPKGTAKGTGFLVGSNTVITNYHVVKSVIENKASPNDLVLRFDYKRMEDGTTLNDGNCVGLANNWLIDSSPYSPVDLEPEPKSGLPQTDQLDYALLRTNGRPGDLPIGETAEANAKPRGWIDPPKANVNVAPSTTLMILQHPLGEPLKLAIDSVLKENVNGTRLTYTTNSEKGSSGSPCFNIKWDLVALHHSGDPNSDIGLTPTSNEGVPFVKIMEQLTHRGYSKYLGKQDLD
jgi:hypothetical protein